MGKILWRILAVLAFLIFAVSTVFLVLSLRGCEGDLDPYRNSDATQPSYQPTEETPTEAPPTEPELPENPIEFSELTEVNPDIYAWIKVPGTPIDYPVLQSDEQENYYLRRDFTGAYSVSGCIFSQYLNQKDFSDPNTILYGHYMFDGTFFGSLHDFRDADFFDQNRYIYIYLPGKILTYEIFAAYEYDNRHILKAFNFDDKAVFEEYLQSCMDPRSMNRNVRKDVKLTTDDRLLTLSTCVQTSDPERRYLVQGVLIDEQPTK